MDMPPISALKTHWLLDGESSKNPRESLVALDLCLDEMRPSENANKGKTSTYYDPKVASRSKDNKLPEKKRNPAHIRLLSDEERREEERYNVSTKPTLFTDRWTMKTKLTNNNLGHESCLPLSNTFVDDHILICFPEDDKRKVKEGSELTVNVYDHDTDSMHQFLLRYWPKGQCYALFNGWPLDFFYRRALREDDTIGIYWDRTDFKLHFCVLSPTPMEVTSEPLNLARMRLLSDKKRREKKKYNISTKPTLFTDRWTIKKRLAKSHVDHKSCFPLNENNNEFVEEHILTCFLKDDEKKVKEGSRSIVNVYDHDSDSMHRLLLRHNKGYLKLRNNGFSQLPKLPSCRGNVCGEILFT